MIRPWLGLVPFQVTQVVSIPDLFFQPLVLRRALAQPEDPPEVHPSLRCLPHGVQDVRSLHLGVGAHQQSLEVQRGRQRAGDGGKRQKVSSPHDRNILRPAVLTCLLGAHPRHQSTGMPKRMNVYISNNFLVYFRSQQYVFLSNLSHLKTICQKCINPAAKCYKYHRFSYPEMFILTLVYIVYRS